MGGYYATRAQSADLLVTRAKERDRRLLLPLTQKLATKRDGKRADAA